MQSHIAKRFRERKSAMQHFPVMPESAFGERIDALKRKMDQSAIDLVVLYANLLDPSAVRYFSDFSAINESSAMLILLEAEPILCSGQACHEWSRDTSKAADIITDGFAFASSRIKPGIGELAIQADLESQMLRLGAEGYCNSFAPMVPSGPVHSNLCMNRNTLRKIQEQEIVDLQAVCLYEGYNVVICSPVVPGKVPQDIKKAAMTAYGAFNVAGQSMKSGVSSKELYRTYHDFLDKKGDRKFSPYGSVHSIGFLECESEFFGAECDVWMQEDMAVAVDVYFKGLPWGSFRIEDTTIIKNDGAELITRFNEQCIEDTFR